MCPVCVVQLVTEERKKLLASFQFTKPVNSFVGHWLQTFYFESRKHVCSVKKTRERLGIPAVGIVYEAVRNVLSNQVGMMANILLTSSILSFLKMSQFKMSHSKLSCISFSSKIIFVQARSFQCRKLQSR